MYEKQTTNKWGVFVAVALMIMMINLDATIIYLALDPIGQTFHSSLTTMQWLVNIYLLMAASLFIFAGKSADMFGKKKVYLFGVLIFTLASVIAGFASNPMVLIVARALQGVGFASTFTVAILIVVGSFPVEQRGLALGSIIGVTGFSQAIGPTLGGFIIHYFNWRWIFLMNLPLGIASILLTLMFYKGEVLDRVNRRIDYVGAIILFIALSILITSLNELGAWGLMSGNFLLSIFAVFLLLVFFFLYENKTKNPLINLSIFNDKSYVAVNVLRFIYMYGWLIVLFLIPLYLQNIKGLNALEAGSFLLCMTVLFGILSPLMGRFLDKYGSKVPTIIALFSAFFAFLCFMNLKGTSTYWPVIFGLLFLGFSAGIILSSSAKAALASLDVKSSGVGMGVFYTLAFIGGAIGVAVAGSQLNVQSFQYLSTFLTHAHIKLTPDQLLAVKNIVNGTSSINHLQQYLSSSNLFQVKNIVMKSFDKTFVNIMTICAVLMAVAIFSSFFLHSKKEEISKQKKGV